MFLLIEVILGFVILDYILKLYKYSNYLKDGTLPETLISDIKVNIQNRVVVIFLLIILQLLIVKLY